MPLPDWPGVLLAVREADTDTFRNYVRDGVDFRVTLTGTYNALDLAAFHGHVELVKLIVDGRTFCHANPEEQTIVLKTALIAAFLRTRYEVAKIITKTADHLKLILDCKYTGSSVRISDLLSRCACNLGRAFGRSECEKPYSEHEHAARKGYRKLLLYHMKKRSALFESFSEQTKIPKLVLACVTGEFGKIKEHLKPDERWRWATYCEAFNMAAMTGNTKLMDSLINYVKAFVSPEKIKVMVDSVVRGFIEENRMDIVEWGLERESKDGVKYISWDKVTVHVSDENNHSVCEMIKLIFAMKYQNRYDVKSQEPDLGTIFSRACIVDDVETADFILSEYGTYYQWRAAGEIGCGHGNHDIVRLMIRHGLRFEGEFGKRFAVTMFGGILDTQRGKRSRWFVALPALELILKQMVRTNYKGLNPWTIYLGKKSWGRGQDLDQRWTWAFAHTQATVSLLGKYFSIPDAIRYKLSNSIEQLWPVRTAKVLSLTTCCNIGDFTNYENPFVFLQWMSWSSSLVNDSRYLKPLDVDYFIRDFIICQAGSLESTIFTPGDLFLISELMKKLKTIRVFTCSPRFQFFFELCRSCGFSVGIGERILELIPELLQEWAELSALVTKHASSQISLATTCRVSILACLRKNRAPLRNSVMALEPHLTRVALGQLLYEEFYDGRIPPPTPPPDGVDIPAQ